MQLRWMARSALSAVAVTACLSAHTSVAQAVDGPRPRLLGGFIDRTCGPAETLVEQVSCLVDQNAGLITRNMYRDAVSLQAQQTRDYFTLVETISHVQLLASSARYSLVVQSPHFTEVAPGMDVEKALFEGVGICGQHTELAVAILTRLGYKTRRVQFYGDYWARKGQRFSHIALEVWTGGHWAYIDPTYGFLVTDKPKSFRVLDVASLRARRTGHLVMNNMDSWTQYGLLTSDVRGYLRAPNIDLVVGGTGLVSVPMTRDDDGGQRAVFSDIPNYVGDNLPDGSRSLSRLRLNLKANRPHRLTLKLAGAACPIGNLSVNGEAVSLDAEGMATLEVRAPVVLSVESTEDVCYFVLESIATRPTS